MIKNDRREVWYLIKLRNGIMMAVWKELEHTVADRLKEREGKYFMSEPAAYASIGLVLNPAKDALYSHSSDSEGNVKKVFVRFNTFDGLKRSVDKTNHNVIQ